LVVAAILTLGTLAMRLVPPKYDPAKVHPVVRDVREPLKRLELTPSPNGCLIEFIDAEGELRSAYMEHWNTGEHGESGNWHKLLVRREPNGQAERVENFQSETSLALADLVYRYAKPGKTRDDVLFYLTDGQKYRWVRASRALKQKIGGT